MNKYIAKYKSLNLPGQLITINVIIWMLTQVMRLMCYLITGHDLRWEDWLALHADWESFLYTPWTLLTYFFLHANFGHNVFHLIFNMFWLWWFGQFFLRYHTSRQLLGVYLLGGMSAGLVYLLSFNLLTGLSSHPLDVVVGASGAIFALVGAVAIRQPEEPLYLNFFVRVVPVKMKWFALFALLLNIMNLANGENTGGIICHLGGASFGIAFGLFEKQGMDLTKYFLQICDKVKELFPSKPKMSASRGGARSVPNDRQKDHDYNTRQRDHQQKVDAILDKISKSGYDGLTAEEKAFLFDASHHKKS